MSNARTLKQKARTALWAARKAYYAEHEARSEKVKRAVLSAAAEGRKQYEAARSLVGRDYTRISEYERTRYGKKETVSEHFKHGIRAKHVLYGWGIVNPAHKDKQGMVDFIPKGGEVLCVGRSALVFA